MRSVLAVLLLALVASTTGCQSMRSGWGPLAWFDVPSGIPWKAHRNPKGTPVRMAATWTEAVLNTQGSESQRGFGGKIFFYGRKDERPIETKGQLVVYAFEENGRKQSDQCPTRRYVFPPEEFSRHMSESELGVAYSFWLPWDSASTGLQRDISLIARFEPMAGGEMIASEQTKHRLPGQVDARTELAQQAPTVTHSVAQVSYNEPVKSEPVNSSEPAINSEPATAAIDASKLQTTSIALPGSIRRRASAVAEAAPEAAPTRVTTSVSLLSPAESIRPMVQQR